MLQLLLVFPSAWSMCHEQWHNPLKSWICGQHMQLLTPHACSQNHAFQSLNSESESLGAVDPDTVLACLCIESCLRV